METIHPIILISLPGVGEEMVGGVLDKLSVSHTEHSRFFRHVSVSETGVLSCNLKDDLNTSDSDVSILNLELNKSKGRQYNFSQTYNKRRELIHFFNKVDAFVCFCKSYFCN